MERGARVCVCVGVEYVCMHAFFFPMCVSVVVGGVGEGGGSLPKIKTWQ